LICNGVSAITFADVIIILFICCCYHRNVFCSLKNYFIDYIVNVFSRCHSRFF